MNCIPSRVTSTFVASRLRSTGSIRLVTQRHGLLRSSAIWRRDDLARSSRPDGGDVPAAGVTAQDDSMFALCYFSGSPARCTAPMTAPLSLASAAREVVQAHWRRGVRRRCRGRDVTRVRAALPWQQMQDLLAQDRAVRDNACQGMCVNRCRYRGITGAVAAYRKRAPGLSVCFTLCSESARISRAPIVESTWRQSHA